MKFIAKAIKKASKPPTRNKKRHDPEGSCLNSGSVRIDY